MKSVHDNKMHNIYWNAQKSLDDIAEDNLFVKIPVSAVIPV